MKNFLTTELRKFGLELSIEQLRQLQEFYEFLVEFNSHTNLIAPADEKTIWLKHFVDSLSFSKLPISGELKLLDIGSGGGFPSIVLAIAYPQSKVYAVDSVGKKVNFLNQAAEKTGINNRFEALQTRAEDLPQEFRDSFDFVTARAVSSLNTLSEYCIPYLKKGGLFVAYKSKEAQNELKEAQNAIKLLGARVAEVVGYNLADFERNLIVIEKISKTSLKYPRKAGLPKKAPL